MSDRLSLVLLIDDNHLTNSLNERTLLASKRVDKIVCRSGIEQAMDWLRRANKGLAPWPDLIFLDIFMPGGTGWDFLEDCRREFGGFKANSVVMLTSSPDAQDLMECSNRSEIQDFVIKPLTAADSLRIIDDHLTLENFASQ